MKKSLFLTGLLCLSIWASAQEYQGNRISKEINSYKQQHDIQGEYDILSSEQDATDSRKSTSEISYFQVDTKHLSKLAEKPSPYLHLKFPKNDEKKYDLELLERQILTDDFKLVYKSSPNTRVAYKPGKFYMGIISGDNNSIASLRIKNNQLQGMIATDEGNFFLNPSLNTPENESYTIEKAIIKESANSDFCTDDISGAEITYSTEQLTALGVTEAALDDIIVRVYIEIDYPLVQKFGSPEATVDFVTGAFSQTALLYQNEGVHIQISEIAVWDGPGPYSRNYRTGQLIKEFQAELGSFNGDIGMVLSPSIDRVAGNSSGYAANIGGLCHPDTDERLVACLIEPTYKDLMEYSSTVFIMAHEMGHTMGLLHTHVCVWNGKALDDCHIDGALCGGKRPVDGGTIMSYCNQDPGTGINFNKGFGELPGNVLRFYVANAPCFNDQPADDYCLSYASSLSPFDSTSYAYIDEVNFESINNVSGDNDGYGDFTDQVATVRAGSSVTFSARWDSLANPPMAEFPWFVWMDFNRDMDFDDPGEVVIYGAERLNSHQITRDIAIPRYAKEGDSRMRVMFNNLYGAYTEPCEIIQWGEVEEYGIHILPEYDPGSCSPPSNFTVTNIGPYTAQLNFTAGSGNAEGYSIRLRENVEGYNLDTVVDVRVSQLPVVLSTLKPNTNYAYEIRTNCSGGAYSEYSATRYFTTASCGTPEIESFSNIGYTWFTVNWDNTGIDSLTIRYREKGSDIWLMQESKSGDSLLIDGLAEGTIYQVQIGMYCENTEQIQYSDIKEVTTKALYLVEFIIRDEWENGATIDVRIYNNTIHDINGWELIFDLENSVPSYVWNAIHSISGQTNTFRNVNWNGTIGAGSFVEFGFNASKTGKIIGPDDGILNGNTVPVIIIDKNEPTDFYTISVRARGTSGSETINLTVGGVVVGSWTLSTAYQDYEVSVDNAGGINVEFTNDASGRDVQVDYVVINGITHQAENQSENTAAWDGSCGNGSYTEWMHCNGYIGFSAFKSAYHEVRQYFEESENQEVSEYAPFELYPNPTESSLNFTWAGATSGKAVFTIYNTFGKLVKEGVFELSDAKIDISDLSDGIFLIKLTHNEKNAFSRFIKQ